MSKIHTAFLFSALVTALSTGCVEEKRSSAPDLPSPAPAPKSASSTESTSPVETAVREDEITLVPADEKDLDALISKNKGKVIFVDYWAMFCGPCKKAFPHTVEMHKKHQAEGLVVISIDFDLLEEQDKALAFLKEQGATFNNLISKYDGGGSDANDAFGIGPLPHLRLYDRQGKLRHKWEGKAEDLDAKVKELLAEKE
jgi:thiol-disulfide isomerase/thioredoxin